MVRPYEVSEPFLFGDVDSDVLAFAQEKFASLARGVISRMQRWEASGIFEGEAEGFKTDTLIDRLLEEVPREPAAVG